MTTDNRTNEPTPEQVEAAVHAAWVKSREFRGVGGQAEFAPPWEFQQIIRAALVAAQGAAPQAESGVDEEALAEVIGGVLAGQEAMHCNRVWEAWGHGTMSEDDFSLVSDDEEAVTEIARAVAEWLKGVGR